MKTFPAFPSFPCLLGLALLPVVPTVSSAAIVTLPTTGWTHDIVINNGGGAYNTTVTGTMDNGPDAFEGWTFAEAGTYPIGAENTPVVVGGLTSGTYSSATGSGAQFSFQSFTAPNALLLTGGSSGILTLADPVPVSSLALFGTVSGGATSASVVLNFSDTTTSTYLVANGEGIGRDWFGPEGARALVVGDRVSNRGEDGYTNLFYQQNSVISIHESVFSLLPADQTKAISSITVTNTGGGRLALMAVSAEAIPEASTITLLLGAGLAGLRFRRRS